MRQWENALAHFRQLLNDCPGAEEMALQEIDRCEKRLEESLHGTYDVLAIWKKKNAGERRMDLADYRGPVKGYFNFVKLGQR